MPLSPHEEKALAALEEGLRADDPALAAVLAAAPPSSSQVGSPASLIPPLRARHMVSLLVALLGLIVAGTVLGDRPAALAGLTAALVLPWLVGTARSMTRRPGAVAAGTHRGRGRRPARLRPIGYGVLALGVTVLLVGLAVTPPTARAVIGLVVVLVVAPVVALRVLSWMDRGTR